MNEFDLIKKYLGTVGFRVFDVRYFREEVSPTLANPTANVGVAQGYQLLHQFFFGNVSIRNMIGGVILPADTNMCNFHFYTVLYGGFTTSEGIVPMGVNCGMSMLGDGTYAGHKRLYGMSCNQVELQPVDMGAATMGCMVNFNGYLFTLI